MSTATRGLWDYRKRQPSPKRVPMAMVEKVLGLCQEQYFDFNVRHFYEKLRDQHDITLSYGWGEDGFANSGAGAEAKEAGIAPQAKTASVAPRYDAAH